MPRIIIDYENYISPEDALLKVSEVVRAGQISCAGNIFHYCWVTIFEKYTVLTRRKKTKDSADSFIVQKTHIRK